MSSPLKTKNDVAWEQLFDQYQILKEVQEHGKFVISARSINPFREARLMTKFDYSSNLPSLFKENQLAILPITRGDYVIARFNAYEKIASADREPVQYVDFPEHIQSIDYENISSEAAAINCAHVSGILADFLEDGELLPTVSGRMSSGSFEFGINCVAGAHPLTLKVMNSQIEIDGGYEGIDSLALLEAKVSISDDFLVRQLFYPFRLWRERVAKTIKPIFLIYSNGVFRLYQYRFEDPHVYNSLCLLKQQRYRLVRKHISLDDICELLKSTPSVVEPPIAFPQADSFERVINLCELLFEANELSREEITTTYDFDVRQTNYYTDAARYLGFIDKRQEDGVHYFLTDPGKALFKKGYRARQLGFATAILQHSTFSQTLGLYLQRSAMPTRPEIVEIMRSSNLYKVNADSTYHRRASTVQSWVNWILSLQD